ncbi:MAG: serine/threonine-protein phosphatase [bacterium]|nr:serine/threonine-protein phosphatase [bacterium]
MDKKKMNLFYKEENIINSASQKCSEGQYSDNELLAEFKSLVDNYGLLLRQTRKLVRMSDSQQKQLNFANERLSELTEEKTLAYEKLNELYKHLKQDLSFAKQIQENILPRKELTIPGLDYYIHFLPTIEVGGDIYDIEEIRPGYVRIFLADAAGHGIQAALITMIIKSEYEMIKQIIKDPMQLLLLLNEIFVTTHKKLNVYFTCVVVDIDLRNKKIIYSSAGHVDQYLINNNEIITLEHTGKLIGFTEDTKIHEIKHDIKKGNKIVLFSDGLYEQIKPDGDGFGKENCFKSIDSYKELPPSEIIKNTLNDLNEFMDGEILTDDQIVIGIEIANNENE